MNIQSPSETTSDPGNLRWSYSYANTWDVAQLTDARYRSRSRHLGNVGDGLFRRNVWVFAGGSALGLAALGAPPICSVWPEGPEGQTDQSERLPIQTSGPLARCQLLSAIL